MVLTEYLFQEQGVPQKSLQNIAQRAAGTAELSVSTSMMGGLFNAMTDRVSLPLQTSFARKALGPSGEANGKITI